MVVRSRAQKGCGFLFGDLPLCRNAILRKCGRRLLLLLPRARCLRRLPSDLASLRASCTAGVSKTYRRSIFQKRALKFLEALSRVHVRGNG